MDAVISYRVYDELVLVAGDHDAHWVAWHVHRMHEAAALMQAHFRLYQYHTRFREKLCG